MLKTTGSRVRERELHHDPVGAPDQRQHRERDVGAAPRSHGEPPRDQWSTLGAARRPSGGRPREQGQAKARRRVCERGWRPTSGCTARASPRGGRSNPRLGTARRRSCKERFDRRGHRCRLVVMQHVPGVGDRHHPAVAECARSGAGCRRSCRWRPRPPDGRRATSECSSPPRRPTASAPRCCARPRRSPPSDTPSETAACGADRRTRRARPSGSTSAQWRARNTALSRGSRAIVLLQPIGDGVEARVDGEILRRRERVEPFRDLVRRRVRVLGPDAEAVERHDGAHALRAHARVVQDHVAAEAVARRGSPSRPARTSRAAPRGRRRSRRTSSPAAATRCFAVTRAGPARSRTNRAANASTRNWNDAATSIQPCSRNSFGAAGSPHVSTLRVEPAQHTRCERACFNAVCLRDTTAPRAIRRGLRASFPAAEREAVLPAGAIVAVGAEARRVLALGAGRARAAVGVALPVRQRESRTG